MPMEATLEAIEDDPTALRRYLNAPLASCSLFGFNFLSDWDLSTIVDRITGPQPTDDLLPFVLTPNVDYIVRLREPGLADLAEILPRARYVLPDGQPIVWTSRFSAEPLAGRLPGSSMFPVIWKRVVEERRRTMIVAASQETADQLTREYPEAGVIVPPHFDADDQLQLARVAKNCRAMIEELEPEFVFVGISFPKQQRLALSLVDSIRASGGPMPIFLLLGGSFEMYLGQVKRAPSWMQHLGLEWFFRFMQEPRRLFRRYFVTDTRFLGLFVKELFRLRGSRRSEFA
jgi:N-acetylglucosaminyldiphosphoundecaprenol N-acetyl-beta-D-mannosaminyltransferase